jgi:hypothetical protein
MIEGSQKTYPEDTIELLRTILESKQSRSVSYSEAQEVGDSLLCFYELLAGVSDVNDD